MSGATVKQPNHLVEERVLFLRLASKLWYLTATATPSRPSKTVPHGAPEGLVEAQLFDSAAVEPAWI